jgi:hypothetical protein
MTKAKRAIFIISSSTIIILIGSFVSNAHGYEVSLPGDVNGNNRIDIFDFNQMVEWFGKDIIQETTFVLKPNLYPGETEQSEILGDRSNWEPSVILYKGGFNVTFNPGYEYIWSVTDQNIAQISHSHLCDPSQPQFDICNNSRVSVNSLQVGESFINVQAKYAGQTIATVQIPLHVYPPEKMSCLEPSIAPDTGDAPLTTFFHGGSQSLQPGLYFVGYQWDFNRDGVWDTFTEKDGLNHTFYKPGTYKPRYRIVGSNNTLSPCDYPFDVVVSGENQPTPINIPDMTTKHPVNLQTETVSITADNMIIDVNGQYFYPFNDPLQDNGYEVRSDPGRNNYTTLEASWDQYFLPMNFYLYFGSSNGKWYVTEARTSSGIDDSNSNWIFFSNESQNMFTSDLGQPYTADALILHSNPNVFTGEQAKIYFENLRILPTFRN